MIGKFLCTLFTSSGWSRNAQNVCKLVHVMFELRFDPAAQIQSHAFHLLKILGQLCLNLVLGPKQTPEIIFSWRNSIPVAARLSLG